MYKKCFWLLITLFVLLFTIAPLAAQQTGVTVYSTAQRFENGLMIWRSDTAHIWVLGNNGQALSFPASSYTPLPDNPIFGDPPSRLRPIFGFGKVWGNFANVRTLLGWPTLPELGFNMPITYANRTYYLTQLDGSIIQINPNNTWMRVTQSLPPSTARIVSFTVQPNLVTPGGMLSIFWDVEGVELVMLEVTGAQGGDYIGALQDLPLEGSTTMTVPYHIQDNIRAVIWGANRIRSGGNTMFERVVQSTLTIDLILQPAPTTTQAVFQPYERGFMIWRADTGAVYAFYNGGLTDSWQQSAYEGLPDNTLAAPAGFVTPVNGFGRVWGNVQDVRDRLGRATGVEQGYQLTVTRSPGPPLFLDPRTFTLPDGRVLYFVYYGRYWGIL